MGHNDTPFGWPTPGWPIRDEEWIIIRRPLTGCNDTLFKRPTPGRLIGDEEWIVIRRSLRGRNQGVFAYVALLHVQHKCGQPCTAMRMALSGDANKRRRTRKRRKGMIATRKREEEGEEVEERRQGGGGGKWAVSDHVRAFQTFLERFELFHAGLGGALLRYKHMRNADRNKKCNVVSIAQIHPCSYPQAENVNRHFLPQITKIQRIQIT
jgi:hypothetical protein